MIFESDDPKIALVAWVPLPEAGSGASMALCLPEGGQPLWGAPTQTGAGRDQAASVFPFQALRAGPKPHPSIGWVGQAPHHVSIWRPAHLWADPGVSCVEEAAPARPYTGLHWSPGPEENPNPDSWADQSPSHIFYAYDKTVLL